MKNIAKSTYFIKGGTNTGVYTYGNNAAIIDPGLAGARPKRILKKIEDAGFELKYILNTHEHDDHYGGCGQIKEQKPSVINVSSAYGSLYIENPILFPTYIVGGNSCEIMINASKMKERDITTVDKVITEGIFDLNTGECIEDDERTLSENEIRVVDLKGHTEGSMGFLTPDGVFFIGDLLVGEEMLDKFDFLFTFDVAKQLKSLDKLESMEYDKIVLGHSREIITREESKALIEKNRAAVIKYINQVKEILSKEELGYDKLLKHIIVDNDLKCNYKEYHFFKSALVSLVAYLLDNGEIDYKIEDGELLYFLKEN